MESFEHVLRKCDSLFQLLQSAVQWWLHTTPFWRGSFAEGCHRLNHLDLCRHSSSASCQCRLWLMEYKAINVWTQGFTYRCLHIIGIIFSSFLSNQWQIITVQHCWGGEWRKDNFLWSATGRQQWNLDHCHQRKPQTFFLDLK